MELLKLLVLLRAGIFFEETYQANELSEIILNSTGKLVAGSTLLQVYEYTPTKLPPSLYTKDVLAMFCGYKDFDDFTKEITF